MRSNPRTARWIPAACLTLLAAAATHPVHASDLQRTLESRWRGAWVLTSVDTYSDCAGFHTNNSVSGSLVSSKGHYRFRPGELGQIGKVDLKRSRLELLVGFPEPVLVSYQDGPFTLYNEARCLVQLDVELPRSVVASDDLNGVENAVRQALQRFNSDAEATRTKAYNGRKREAYPANYDRTLAEHEVWKAQQTNAAIQARLDKAMQETSRLTDRITTDPDYLKGFAAGVEAMKAVDLTRCPDLIARDPSNVPAPSTQQTASFGGGSEAQGRHTRGYQDGERLVLGLAMLARLPGCMVPVPAAPAPAPPPPRRGN